MTPILRFVLAALVSFNVASSALAYPVSVSTSGTSAASGVLFSTQLTSFFPPEPTSLRVADGSQACPPPPVICGYLYIARGEAYADLAAGTLGVYVDGYHVDSDGYTFLSHASFTDTLVFHLPPGMSSTQVTLFMSLDADLPAQNIYPRVGGAALIGLGQDASFLYLDAAAGSRPTHFSQVLPVTTTVLDGLPIDVTADLSVVLTLVQTDHGAYAIDALHTAALSISVPAGVTYESASGVFLTAVDEPSLAQLVGSSALGALAAVRHSTKRRRARL